MKKLEDCPFKRYKKDAEEWEWDSCEECLLTTDKMTCVGEDKCPIMKRSWKH